MNQTFLARARVVAVSAGLMVATSAMFAQQIDPAQYQALRWRLIGPFRAGRVSAGAVDPSDPNTYYIGTPGGGVWKSTNAGQTWNAIFDRTGVASVGAVALAPSNPRVIYVGTGEESRGNGVYKSTDGGATWTSIGLEQTHFIGSIVVDAKNPDVVVVGAIGDRTPSPDRGIFRSNDGGKTWNKVVFVDDVSGCPAIIAAPDAPQVLYASLYPAAAARGAAQVPPLPPGGAPSIPAPPQPPPARAPAIYKSADGGATWTKLAAKGLTGPAVGRQAFAIIAGSAGRSVVAGLRDGLYRSDDGGETWRRSTDDPRIRPFGVIADPQNPNVLYVTQTSMYRSTDGGKTFEAFAGAPSGDDFQLLWIDPRNSRRLLAGVDQGGIVSEDGGASWSSWYNQPTGQFYHVSTDDRFPYHVFAAQQDSGSVAVPNRSDFGEISYRDWYSPGGFEFGYVVPDPLDANTVFGGGWYRTVVRFDKRTGQIVHVFVPGTKYRSVNNAPMAFSPQDPKTLYLGTQYVMKTTDRGTTWQEISPDLTDVPGRRSPPAAVGARGPQGASITTLSASTVSGGVIWIGTNNAVIQVTENGGTTWAERTPKDVAANGTFEIIDAGRHDAATAYAAFIVPQDVHPYIYRTHDRGMTWQKIVAGLPDTAFARVVREDPVRKGLLYCGTEAGVYVSFDDGDHWQSLQLNLPSSSMRDMVVHGDDLVLVTYGRAIWILDDIAPLRQIGKDNATADVRLVQPAPAIRARWDVYGDTPLPIETPTAPNPPEGAIIDYYLTSPPAGDLKLTITDARGKLVRTYSSVKPPEPTLLANVPSYWFAPPPLLTKSAGHNRFTWNLRYPTPKVLPFGYFGGLLSYVEYTLADHAIPGLTPREQPEGALVVPGQYTIELTAGGRSVKQAIAVKPDPRITATEADLGAQSSLATLVTDALEASYDGYFRLSDLRTAIADRVKTIGEDASAKDLAAAAKTVEEQVAAVQSGTPSAPGLGLVNRDMARYFTMIESGDAAPVATLRTAVMDTCRALSNAIDEWRQLNRQALPAVNAKLAGRKLAPLPIVTEVPQAPACDR